MLDEEREKMKDSLKLPGEDSEEETPQVQTKRDGLSNNQLWAYSVGHVCNDLCASMWFIYLSYYLQYVVGLSPEVTGKAILSGQITDGITTPIVGALSDKLACPAGRRNCWYYMGSALVLPSFLGIFYATPGFLTTQRMEDIWYCTLPAIFNVGWASVQIAHMSIVNQLSYSQRRRDKMVNNRNGFTYAANIIVLTVALILFLVIDNGTLCFSILCIFCLSLGSVATVFYICRIPEKSLSAEATRLEAEYR